MASVWLLKSPLLFCALASRGSFTLSPWCTEDSSELWHWDFKALQPRPFSPAFPMHGLSFYTVGSGASLCSLEDFAADWMELSLPYSTLGCVWFPQPIPNSIQCHIDGFIRKYHEARQTLINASVFCFVLSCFLFLIYIYPCKCVFWILIFSVVYDLELLDKKKQQQQNPGMGEPPARKQRFTIFIH